MGNIDHGQPPNDTHYAKLLAALCRSARAKPAEQRAMVMRGVVRSIDGNDEPERTGITKLILMELSAPDARELSEFLANGPVAEAVTADGPPTGRRERRRHSTGDALSTPWLPARERRRLI